MAQPERIRGEGVEESQESGRLIDMSEEQLQVLRMLTSLSFDEPAKTVTLKTRGWGEIRTFVRLIECQPPQENYTECESVIRVPHEAAHKKWIETEATTLAEFNVADIFHVLVSVNKTFVAAISHRCK